MVITGLLIICFEIGEVNSWGVFHSSNYFYWVVIDWMDFYDSSIINQMEPYNDGPLLNVITLLSYLYMTMKIKSCINLVPTFWLAVIFDSELYHDCYSVFLFSMSIFLRN
jgi:hypothetical protein